MFLPRYISLGRNEKARRYALKPIIRTSVVLLLLQHQTSTAFVM